MADALSAGTVSLPVKPDTSNFGRDTEAGIAGQVSAHKSGFGGIGKTIGLAIGAAAAVAVGAAIVDVAKTGIRETLDASAGQAQLEAGIKSTGNAANVTVGSLQGLATSLQGVTGQTDDSVVKAEQLLLTFTNIRNVGADKIFDDATVAASNMAAKFGGDASQQAIVLGKALNDPIRGMTALRRVGVSFTEQQTEQVKAMVATGDTIGAQKVILGELTKEFGGAGVAAGKSLPGQLAIAQRSFEDFSQGIVETFIPIVLPVLQKVLKVFQDNGPAIQKVAGEVATGLKQAFRDATPFIKDVGNFFHDTLGPALGSTLDFLGRYKDIIPPVVTALGAMTVAAWLLDVALDANPIGLVVIGLEAIIATAVVFGSNMGGITQQISNFLFGIAGFAAGVGKSIAGVFDGLANGVIGALQVMLGPINAVREAVHLGPITLPKANLSSILAGTAAGLSLAQTTLNLDYYGAGQGYSSTGSGKAGKPSTGAAKALADGGTVLPSPGGTLVRVAEAGRSETVVDTATLNAAMNRKGGDVFHITEAVSSMATAMQVSRLQNLRRS